MEHSQNQIGVDEVGRGCLFGNVVAAAVMLPASFDENDKLWKQIKDSKKVSEKKRYILDEYIRKTAICYGIGECTHEEIDSINILQASIKAMKMAIDNAYAMLKDDINVEKIMIDGDKFKTCYIVERNGEDLIIPHECIPNGDNIHLNIAAASIIAKCYRDTSIVHTCMNNPVLDRYGLKSNKGYGTPQHIKALKEFGPIKGHRLTFRPIAL